jgi:peptidoglycan/LPS O-acetylase OafA/YrhL
VFLAASHLPGSLPEFLLGASAAMVVQWFDLKSLNRPPAWLLDVLLLTGVILVYLWFWEVLLPHGEAYWYGHWSMIIAPLALGLPLSLIVISLYWGSRLGRLLFANPVVYYLGLISYSLYLWHFVVLQQMDSLAGYTLSKLQGVPGFLLALVLVVLVSSVSYFLFERPFFRLGKRSSANTSP